MSGLLTFLLDRDDLMCLEAQCPQALEGTVVAFDPDLHIHLLSRGRKHLTPWSVVHKHDLDTVRGFEQSVLSFWDAHAHAALAGMDLLQMVRFRHLSCFSRLAWATFVVERVLAAVQPAEVVVFDETTGHGLEQPPEHNKMPLLQPLIRGAAEQRGLSVRVLRRGVPNGGGFVDWAAKRGGVQLPPVDPGSLLGDRPYVLFAGSGVDAIRPLPLVRELCEGGEVAVAQVYKSADSATLRRLADVGHFVWHESPF